MLTLLTICIEKLKILTAEHETGGGIHCCSAGEDSVKTSEGMVYRHAKEKLGRCLEVNIKP